MQILFASWLVVTAAIMVLLLIRGHLQAREVDWMPLATTTEGDIHRQEAIEGKVHRLTPIVHWLEALDVALLFSLAIWWFYRGINTVRW